MPIKNYTTEVAEEKTVGEIMGLLASKGARAIRVDYDERNRPTGVQFIIHLQEQPIPFRLPCNFDGVFRALLRQYKDQWTRKEAEKNPGKRDQARKVAWRILKDWIAAQMALVEAEQAQLAEVFLPYVVQDGGQTLFEYFVEQRCKALPAKGEAGGA